MAWRYTGRARVQPRSPTAFAVCQRCSLWYNRPDLKWQYQYGGNTLFNQYLLVCDTCLDVPQPQLKARILPPDPRPVYQPRPEPFTQDETGTSPANNNPNIVTNSGNAIITVD